MSLNQKKWPLPPGWRWARLGEIFEVQQGIAMSPERRQGIARRPFLRTLNVLWGRVDLSILDQMDFTPEEVVKLNLATGDLLVCEGGDVGRTAIWRGEIPVCLYQNHIHRLRKKENNVLPDFYMLWMQAAYKVLGSYSGQEGRTTIPNLSGSHLKSFLAPLPPLPEQRRIAAHLSDQMAQVEKMRQAAKSQVEAAKTLPAAFLRQVFEAEEAKRWPMRRLGEVCEKPQYGYTAPAIDRPIGPKMLRITDIQNGAVNWNTVPYCQCSQQEIQKYELRPGDIVIARTGSVGKAFFIREVTEKAVFASYLIRVRVSKGLLSPYLYLFMQSPPYWRQIIYQTHGGVQPNVNATGLSSLIVPIPSLSEQQRIAARLTEQMAQAQKLLKTAQTQLEAVNALPGALLEEVFGGFEPLEAL